MAVTAGALNLITDVPGILVGNAEDAHVRTGVTVILPERPAVAAVDARGGGTGSRELELLAPDATVQEIHALVLSGGSAFGLDAAGAVMNRLAGRGIGFRVRDRVVPIVPQAILFDLANGGDKDWGESPPYPALAVAALEAAGRDFALGNAGAGFGSLCGDLKGGLGSASVRLGPDGPTVGALAAVNAVGGAVHPGSGAFYAWDVEIGDEYGGRLPTGTDRTAEVRLPKLAGQGENTTIAVVATDAALTKAQCRRLAVMAQQGLSHAVRPAHTPLDGDTVFALSTGRLPLADPLRDLALLGGHAANCLARAIARGVHRAESLGSAASYRARYG